MKCKYLKIGCSIQVELAPVLASLPASTSLHRLAGFLTGSLEARCEAIFDFILSHISLGIMTVDLTLQVLDLNIPMSDITLQMLGLTLL